jgi:pimeloyl-ACP methyl ester carboxylesterase
MKRLIFLKSAKLFSLAGLILLTSLSPIDQGSFGKKEKSFAPDRVNNIVLVHGAWADGSGWDGVYKILKAKGYHITVVPNPNTSLSEDVKITKAVLAMQEGPVILVGHSYGGAIITEAGDTSNVAGLVYVAAFAPCTSAMLLK